MHEIKTKAFSSLIPVAEPMFAGNELEYVLDCLKSGSISSLGPYVDEFERIWASYCGRKHGIAVSSGTAALQIALDSLKLEAGDEVILPSFTIISCVLAVLRAGALPVLVDCDPETFCLDPDLITEKITSRTRAVMVVDMYGHPVNVDKISKIAKKNDLIVIEDAAQAHGSEFALEERGKPAWYKCGKIGLISTFSFYGNKIVTTGEGGMALTDDDLIAERLRGLRNLYFGDVRYQHVELGYSFRLSNLQAAVGTAQVENLDNILSAKRSIGDRYDQLFSGVVGLRPQVKKEWAKTNCWMYAVVIDDSVRMDADELKRRLLEAGIDSRPFFLGMHEQIAFQRRDMFRNLKLPVTERLSRRGLCIPSGVTLTSSQAEEVASAIQCALSG